MKKAARGLEVRNAAWQLRSRGNHEQPGRAMNRAKRIAAIRSQPSD